MVIFLIIFVLPLYIVPVSGISALVFFLGPQPSNDADSTEQEQEDEFISPKQAVYGGVILGFAAVVLLSSLASAVIPDLMLDLLIYDSGLVDNELSTKWMLVYGYCSILAPLALGALFISQKSRNRKFVSWGRGALLSFWIWVPISILRVLSQSSEQVWLAIVP